MSDFRSGLAALALAAFTVTAAPALAQPAGVDAAITARANGGDLAAIRQIGAAYVTAQRASRTRSEGERNEAEAIAWYRKAADKGDYPAMYALGVIYASRDPADGRPAPVVPAGQERFILEDDDVDRTHDPNMQEAVRWFRMAADKGYAPAMFGLGTSYADGSGVDVSGPEAVRWLTKAAELGDTDSMVNLGFYYTRGTIMPRNEAESLRWYRLAADKGNPVAMFLLRQRGLEVSTN